jgi:hypothetical protein
VISWFQAFAFKWVNLCRYVAVLESGTGSGSLTHSLGGAVQALNAADPSRLKAAWFQPLNL